MLGRPRLRHAPRVILAIDQGTTGTTCLVVDEEDRQVGHGSRGVGQRFPQPGWVEHDPEEIWTSVLRSCRRCARAGARLRRRTLGDRDRRTQQRPWSGWTRRASLPRRAIVGRNGGRRTGAASFRETHPHPDRSGSRDPYFSATKLEWIAPDALIRRVEVAQHIAAQAGTMVDARVLAPRVLPGALGKAAARSPAPKAAPRHWRCCWCRPSSSRR